MSDFMCALWESCFSLFLPLCHTAPYKSPPAPSSSNSPVPGVWPRSPTALSVSSCSWLLTVLSLLASFSLIAWVVILAFQTLASIRQIYILHPILSLPLLEVVPHWSFKFSQENLAGDLKDSPSVYPIVYNFKGFFKTKLHLQGLQPSVSLSFYHWWSVLQFSSLDFSFYENFVPWTNITKDIFPY